MWMEEGESCLSLWEFFLFQEVENSKKKNQCMIFFEHRCNTNTRLSQFDVTATVV